MVVRESEGARRFILIRNPARHRLMRERRVNPRQRPDVSASCDREDSHVRSVPLVTACAPRLRGVAASDVARARCCAALCRCARCAAQDDDLPGRVGRVADFAGQLYLVAAGPRRPSGSRSASTIRSRPATTCGSPATAAPRSTTAAGSSGSPAIPTCTCRGSTIAQLALFIAQGRVIVRVRVLDPGDAARIDTPNTQVDADRGRASTASTSRRIGRRRRSSCAKAKRNVALASGVQQALAGPDGDASTGADPDRRRRPQRHGRRWIRHVERESRPPLRAQPRGAYVSRADGRRTRISIDYGTLADRLRNTAPSGFRTAVAPDWAPYRDGYWARSADGDRRGSTLRRGAMRRSTTAAGRTSAAAGAGARAATSRVPSGRRRWSRWYGGPGWGVSASLRRAGLRLGAARLARAVPPRLAAMLVQLLGALQPALRRQRERAPERPAGAPRKSRRPRRAVGGSGDVPRRAHAREVEPRERSRRARVGGDRR